MTKESAFLTGSLTYEVSFFAAGSFKEAPSFFEPAVFTDYLADFTEVCSYIDFGGLGLVFLGVLGVKAPF